MTTTSRTTTWSTLDVEFHAFPTATYESVLEVLDLLAEHYWGRPGWIRRLGDPSLAGPAENGERTVEVHGLPVWMPAWWARRVVITIALCAGVDGWATSQRVTNTLHDW